MARLITLSFPPSDLQLLLADGGGGAASSIPLINPYPVVFPSLARTIDISTTNLLGGPVFTIYGTDQFGNAISEYIQVPSFIFSPATSVNQYHTITAIASDGDYHDCSIGSGETGTFQWIKLDTFSMGSPVTITGEVTGTITYSVNQTIDRLGYYQTVGGTSTYITPVPVSFPVTAGTPATFTGTLTGPSAGALTGTTTYPSLTNATTNQIYNLSAPVGALQGIVTASDEGSLTLNFLQQGIR
jgi:hypothetical protein